MLLRRAYQGIKTAVLPYPRLYHYLCKIRQAVPFTYPESALAHRYLDGLRGIEIGAGAFNPFGLNTLNVNFSADTGVFAHVERQLGGRVAKIDVVALGDQLPFADGDLDFVLSSHVIEHFFDPITALQEWMRVIRPGGYIFLIAPHKERTFDRARPRTTLAELVQRHQSGRKVPSDDTHHNVWITEDFLELCRHLRLNVIASQDRDDKVGNGFTVVIQASDNAAVSAS